MKNMDEPLGIKNQIRILNVQVVDTLSKLVPVFMKVVGYTSCELVHD